MRWQIAYVKHLGFFCACGGCILNGNIICHMCLGEKKYKTIALVLGQIYFSLVSSFLIGKERYFIFCLGLKTSFWWLVKIAFLSATWMPIQLESLSSGHLTLIIKNHLRCPQCLTPPPNSNNFLFFFFSWSSLAFLASLPLYFQSLCFIFWLLTSESSSGLLSQRNISVSVN